MKSTWLMASLTAWLVAPAWACAAGPDAGSLPRYQVSCPEGATTAAACQVDRGIHQGWAFYNRYCRVCHGAGAPDSSAPLALLRNVGGAAGYERLRFVVMNGHEGIAGVMPDWGTEPALVQHLDDLYRYLSARARGDLPPGTPPSPPG
jgi:mono/diheme cytochrome c family protein